MPRQPLAVQLYTLRNEVAKDYIGTLRAVAELGYGAVELVTLGDFHAEALRAELDTFGLRVAGMHVLFEQLEQQLDAVLSDAKALGAPYIVCPWVPEQHRRSEESFRALAKLLGRIGQVCSTQGIPLCYHHHHYELQPFGSTNGLEILFDETDPQSLHAEIDVYWAAFAGVDPVALIRRMAGRVPLVHLKDMAGDAARSFAEVGAGSLDFPAILAACREAGVEWYIVEQDDCARPPLASVGMSLSYLRTLGF
jgi:sugar phosphate isomerase/epimerase